MTLPTHVNSREKDRFVETAGGDVAVRVVPFEGSSINPLAKYVEATYSVGDTVVTYSYYESSSKVTLYNTITTTYTTAQDTSFTSAEWS